MLIATFTPVTMNTLMRTAAIDIGTNSVKLLIADVEGGQIRKRLAEHVIITRLGESLSKSGCLHPRASARTLKVLRKFMELCRALRVKRLHGVSTKVLRQARNRDSFLTSCARLGLYPRVIPGLAESRLGYRGAVSSLTVRRATVIDIGGGSTEISMGSAGRFERGYSLNMGAVALTERFLKHDPPTNDEIERMRRYIQGKIKRLSPRKGMFIGIGGTVATLGFIRTVGASLTPACARRAPSDRTRKASRPSVGNELVSRTTPLQPERIHNTLLTVGQIGTIATALSKISTAQRRKKYRLEPGRADIIVAGALVLLEVMNKLGQKTCRISTRGLRHGLVLDKG